MVPLSVPPTEVPHPVRHRPGDTPPTRCPAGGRTLEDRSLPSGGITLSPDQPAPQLVGTPVTWIATVPNDPSGLVYQFSVGSPGGPFQMVRDFSPDDQFTWAPSRQQPPGPGSDLDQGVIFQQLPTSTSSAPNPWRPT